MEKCSLFYERLSKLVEESGKSMNCIERELGYSRNALHNYKNGGEPSGSRLIEISEYFQVPPVYLIGKVEEPDSSQIRKFFKNLNNEQKFKMLELSQEWWSKKITNKLLES